MLIKRLYFSHCFTDAVLFVVVFLSTMAMCLQRGCLLNICGLVVLIKINLVVIACKLFELESMILIILANVFIKGHSSHKTAIVYLDDYVTTCNMFTGHNKL